MINIISYLQFAFTDPSSEFSWEKKFACGLFSTEKFFPVIFDFHFREIPRFRDEFQALVYPSFTEPP